MAPFRKVSEVSVGIGAPWKVLRIQPVVTSLMDVSGAKRTSKTDQKPTSRTKAKQVSTTDVVAQKPSESLPSVSPPILPIVSSKEEGAVEKMVARQRALLEQVVGVLQLAVTEGTVAAERENGYLLINVRDAEPVLKAGIKASRSQIFGLRGIDPDRFTTEDRKPKLYFRIRA